MAEMFNFPGREKPEEVMREIRQEAIDAFCEQLIAAGWGADRAQGAAVILWAESAGFLRGVLSTGETLPVALSRMRDFSVERLRLKIGLPPSP